MLCFYAFIIVGSFIQRNTVNGIPSKQPLRRGSLLKVPSTGTFFVFDNRVDTEDKTLFEARRSKEDNTMFNPKQSKKESIFLKKRNTEDNALLKNTNLEKSKARVKKSVEIVDNVLDEESNTNDTNPHHHVSLS